MTDMAASAGSGPRTDPTKLTEDAIEKAKAYSDAAVAALKELSMTLLKACDQRQDMAEKLRLEQKADANRALSDAFAAAKELNGLTATFTTAALTALQATFTATAKGLEGDIEAQKERSNSLDNRVTTVEQQKVGSREATTERRDSNAGVYALIGAVAGLLAIGGIFVARQLNDIPPQPVVITVPVAAP